MSSASKELDIPSSLVIWTPGRFADRFKTSFQVICSENEWLESAHKAGSASSIVILAELGWDKKPLSACHGLEIVRRLRAEQRVQCPVIICSFLPLSHFNSNPKYELLKAPGHTFFQLPFRLEKDETLPKYFKRHLDPTLSEELLDDIVDSLCDVKGLVQEVHHRLKNAVVVHPRGGDNNNIRDRIIAAVDEAFFILSHMFPNDARVSETKQRLLSDLEGTVFAQDQYSRAIEHVSQFVGDFERLAPLAADESPAMVEESPWKILYIDDEANLRERVHIEFKRRNLVCFTASNAEEAFSILKEDVKTNAITVLITDYRLESSNGFRKWQDMQGYSIIKEVFLNHLNLLSFFALTAASRRALLRIQKTYQVKVNTLSKEDVLSSDGAFNMFAESVRREGERVFESVCSQPQLTSWTTGDSKFAEPLKHYYRAHRLAMDYESAEADISSKAKAYVENIVEANESTSQPPGHKFQFQAGLPKGSSDPSMLPKFREKLIGRRIALGLYVLLEYYPESIYLAMRKAPFAQGNEIPSILVDEARQSLKPLLSTHLALSLVDDVPDQLLVEERTWLTDILQVDLNTANAIAYTEMEAVIDNFKDELGNVGCIDERVKKKTIIRSLAAAADALSDLKILAAQREMIGRLQQLLKEAYQAYEDSQPGEKRAFRSSGILALLRAYIGRKVKGLADDSDFSIGMED